MKFLLLLLITFSAYANFIPKDEVGTSNPLTVYLKKDKCESSYSRECISIPVGYNHEYHKLVDVMIDDLENPNYEAASNITDCGIEDAFCDDAITSLVCADETYMKIKAEDYSNVYCTKIVSYDQIASGAKEVIEDASLKAAYDTAKAAEDAMNNAIALAMEKIEQGKRVMALLAVRNAVKGLTTTQIALMVNTYSEIKALLETGSLVTAKEKINEMVADGTLVTDSDKVALIAELDKYIL